MVFDGWLSMFSERTDLDLADTLMSDLRTLTARLLHASATGDTGEIKRLNIARRQCFDRLSALSAPISHAA